MAARDNAASVQGEVIRITPLNTDGSIDTTKPILTTSGFISASFGQEFEDGDEITEKAANGAICIQYKADDSMKGVTFNLSLCSPDPEAAALLAGGKVICDSVTGDIVGYSSPAVGDIVGNPVAVEIWSKAIVGGKPASGTPYWHWVFPYVRVRFDGDREFSNGALSNEFSGTGVGNEALVPAGLNPANPVADDYVQYKEALVNPFSYVRSGELPPTGWTGSFTPTSANSIGCATGVAFDPALTDALGADLATYIITEETAVNADLAPPMDPQGIISAAKPTKRADDTAEGPITVTVAAGDDSAAIEGKLGAAMPGGFDPTTDDLLIFLEGTGPNGIVYRYDHMERHYSMQEGPNGDGSVPFADGDERNAFNSQRRPYTHDTSYGDNGYYVK